MKTPREILLARHQAADPKLDAIRQSAVAAVSTRGCDRRPASPTMAAAAILKTLWHELIFPSRRIWAGLATAWLFIVAANMSMRDHSSAATPQVVMSLPQQERLLAELSGPGIPAIAEPQKSYTPRPSSRRLREITTT